MLRFSKLSLGLNPMEKYRRRVVKSQRRRALHVPLKQVHQARYDKARKIAKLVGADPNNSNDVLHMMRNLYSRRAPSQLHQENERSNELFAMQGIGDLEPLSTARNFGLTVEQTAVFNDHNDMMNHLPPPLPYGKHHARRIAEGELWPSAPQREEHLVTLRNLINEEDMSPSAQKTSRIFEFWLRRNLKRCPPHIAEQLDFAQISIDRVIASRRSKIVYVLWSTVHPGARFQMEPHVKQLGRWSVSEYLRYTSHHPHIPQVQWIYNTGISPQLPKKLLREAKAVAQDVGTTLQERIDYLKRMDSLAELNKDVPWFMPYLWSKDEKLKKRRQLLSDVEEVEKREKAKVERAAGRAQENKFSEAPRYVT